MSKESDAEFWNWQKDPEIFDTGAMAAWNAALSYASKQQAERDARIKQLEQQVAFLSHHRAKAETELREILTRGK